MMKCERSGVFGKIETGIFEDTTTLLALCLNTYGYLN